MQTYDKLAATLAEQGYKMGIVPVSYLGLLQQEMQALHHQHSISDELFNLLKQFHHYDYADRDFPVRSVIVVASASSLSRVYISYRGQKIALVIPPTYIDYVTEPLIIENALNTALNPMQYRAVRVQSLPEKPLAVASGIAAYGRNNITYVEGMGSFALLSVYYSDLPYTSGTSAYSTKIRTGLCSKCTEICIQKCPTGALESGRERVRAEKCLTFINEFTGDAPFPQWIDDTVHHCLIGCMRCQMFCPQNRKHITRIQDTVSFDEAETQLLLLNRSLAELPPALVEKLTAINFSAFYYPFLSRNLRALLEKKRTVRPDEAMA